MNKISIADNHQFLLINSTLFDLILSLIITSLYESTKIICVDPTSLMVQQVRLSSMLMIIIRTILLLALVENYKIEYLCRTPALDLLTTVISATQTHRHLLMLQRLHVKHLPHPHIEHISNACPHKQPNFASRMPSATLPPFVPQQQVDQLALEHFFNANPSIFTNPAHHLASSGSTSCIKSTFVFSLIWIQHNLWKFVKK